MSSKESDRLNSKDFFWLLGWLLIGTILRFTNLGDKPASSIEISTLGFSLGHGFSQIPLERLISAATLLSPLQFDPGVSAVEVLHRLLTESTHPPLYFWLTHWWLKLFLEPGELASLTLARSLSGVFGSWAIPAIFGLSWLSFRSRLAAHLTAILMAVSPYGIYLAQEARHYTLTILWIIASLSCMMAAIQAINRRSKLPWWIAIAWIMINSLGMATHYFFSLTLAGEGLLLLGLWWVESRSLEGQPPSFKYWLPIIAVGWGTLIGCLVWLPVASGIADDSLTDWIETDYHLGGIWQPIPRLVGWLITMVGLLPIEGVPIVISILSGAILLLGLMATVPSLIRGGTRLIQDLDTHLAAIVWLGYSLGGFLLALAMIYGYGQDISLAARYHFTYFPGILLLLGGISAKLWQMPQPKIKSRLLQGKQVAIAIVIFGCFGSLTVVNNWGFQKSRHANLLAEQIFTTSQIPAIVGTTYETHAELREAIALALALETNPLSTTATIPQFFLLQRNSEHDLHLASILTAQPKPLYLWGVNLKASKDYLSQLNCSQDDHAKLADSGYKLRVYFCNNTQK